MVLEIEPDDFFSWYNGNFTERFENTFNSTVISDYCMWGSIILFLYIFICPFFGPFLISLFLYFSSFIIWINEININKLNYSSVDHQRSKIKVYRIWKWISHIWHGYEIIGFDTVPKKSTIFVGYHATVNIDGIYINTYVGANCDETYRCIGHIKQTQVKGWRHLQEIFKCQAYTREECIDFLNRGDNVMVAPGGMVESLSSDKKYRVHFGNRRGFAHLALATKANIVPFFTRNQREAFYIPWFAKPFVFGRFAPKKVNLIPGAGGLPVKLTTFFGSTIQYDTSYTPDQLAEKVTNSLQELIDKHQRIPGNTFLALMDRFFYKPKKEVGNDTDFTVI